MLNSYISPFVISAAQPKTLALKSCFIKIYRLPETVTNVPEAPPFSSLILLNARLEERKSDEADSDHMPPQSNEGLEKSMFQNAPGSPKEPLRSKEEEYEASSRLATANPLNDEDFFGFPEIISIKSNSVFAGLDQPMELCSGLHKREKTDQQQNSVVVKLKTISENAEQAPSVTHVDDVIIAGFEVEQTYHSQRQNTNRPLDENAICKTQTHINVNHQKKVHTQNGNIQAGLPNDYPSKFVQSNRNPLSNNQSAAMQMRENQLNYKCTLDAPNLPTYSSQNIQSEPHEHQAESNLFKHVWALNPQIENLRKALLDLYNEYDENQVALKKGSNNTVLHVHLPIPEVRISAVLYAGIAWYKEIVNCITCYYVSLYADLHKRRSYDSINLFPFLTKNNLNPQHLPLGEFNLLFYIYSELHKSHFEIKIGCKITI